MGDEYETALAAESPDPLDPVGVDYVNLHVYTSGTTGRPKAIQLPGFNARHAIEHASEHQTRFGLEGPDEVVLAVCPMHHLAGWSYPHTALVLGQTVVLVDGFDPEVCSRRSNASGSRTSTLCRTTSFASPRFRPTWLLGTTFRRCARCCTVQHRAPST